MNEQLMPAASHKGRARQKMGQFIGACCTLGAAVVVVSLLINWFLQNSGGALSLYYWSTGESDIQTSVSLSTQGLFAALRIEEAGIGFSVAITAAAFGTFLLVRLLAAVVTAPFRGGCMENLWQIQRGQPRPFRAVFSWYSNWHRALSAVCLEVLLAVVQGLLQAVFWLPGLLMLARSGGRLSTITAAMWLLLAGQALAWCVMTQLAPARFLLARDPERGARGALAACGRLLSRRRKKYFLFCLSFILWEVVNALTQGMMELYLYGYQGLANMDWIECAERESNYA